MKNLIYQFWDTYQSNGIPSGVQASVNSMKKYADEMIEKNIRVNNEFYVCPVYNQAIEDGKIIRIHEAKEMWGLGTPEDLEYFLKHKD